MLALAGAIVAAGSCARGRAPAAPPTADPEPVEQARPVPAEPSPPAEPTPPSEPTQPPDVPSPAPEPQVRVGLAVGASSATIGGTVPLSVTDPAGSALARIPAGATWRVHVSGTGLALLTSGGVTTAPAEALGVAAASAADPVWVNGRRYRGVVEVFRDRTGLTVVNRLGLEAYLQGVVSAEMGRRNLAEREALRAQAVISRTYALRNLRRWATDGFDFNASVAAQVYGGVEAETPEALRAVTATRGQVLTYGGAPIDAFFYSTCGGRTAHGTEVFRAAERPYLRSLSDAAEDGTAYCSISPRYRWREDWTGDALRATLQRTLPVETGVSAAQVGEVRDVRVAYRTPSGRVGQLAIALGESGVQVDGPAVRRVLRSATGDLLRSNTFNLTVTGAGQRVTRLVAQGSGAGHGVGLCQWGAVGRSRAGHDYRRIVAAYYPGTTLERLY